MSNKKYAFIDEFGAFGYDFDNQGCNYPNFLVSVIGNKLFNIETFR